MKSEEVSKESRLLDTAYKLFTQKGIKDTSIQDTWSFDTCSLSR